MGYITNFIVYTLAMVGVFVVALLVFKNATSGGCGRSSKHLKLIDSLSLGQRKTLYIVSTGHEQFLIAGDVNNTCLISKLDGLGENIPAQKISTKEVIDELQSSQNSFQETLNSLPKNSYMDRRSNVGIRSSLLDGKTGNSVLRSLADRIKL
jgi:flagellar biogenesis protein FliO